ncbi:ATP-grasp ribosomal peptide maturase [Kribbella sindirgiensis]|uniref:ATP-grasp ribosomal peptide maturase n=1 Tax=Kribbella sindirgiensis TaxID=1124744 RepID=A0A4R0JCK4_9ACTN|nr:ATP-grasp ribosomal peptide maturase [Kribbella sindirgiensis]TCC43600.1 ATP-grasp ribosomal peptide maturase [Kribbella sindirgiensis]
MTLRQLHRPIVMVITEADDVTADAVIAELNKRGRCEVARVDPGEFPRDVSMSASLDPESGRWTGPIGTSSRQFDLADVTSVYWRRPTPSTFPGLDQAAAEFARAQVREGVGGVLASLPNARYVNHPHRNWAAEYKPHQLAVAAELGFNVPATLITADPAVARSFADKHAPIVYKPLRVTSLVREGRAQAIWTRRVEPGELDDSIAGTAHLFQAEVVDKVADLRVTMVGDEVFCVRIDSSVDRLDWRSDYDTLSYQAVEPPVGISERMQFYLRRFGLIFGCFDFALDAGGVPYFLECNPNGQWAWMEPPTGLPMAATFADALEGNL